MADVRVRGFRAAGVHCGIKKSGNPDLAILASDVPATVAGVFSRSTVPGAPVVVSRARAGRGRARAVVVNAGVSNVAMGARGIRDAEAMAAHAAGAVGCEPRDVLVASTGVIGVPLPMAKVRRGIDAAVPALAPSGLAGAARAIMTTDTVPKLASRRIRLGRETVTLAGIAKGSGMIEPDLATMLAFLVTDAAVAAPLLRRLLREVADATFNRLTVDGEGSTSDMVLLLANGAGGAPALSRPRSPGVRRFRDALASLCEELARRLARDGEGATKLVTVHVEGARSHSQAERAARRIANSLLVKTAIFGADPNWGRILQTVGAGRTDLELRRTEVSLCGVPVFRRGSAAGAAATRRAGTRLAERDEVEIRVRLGRGRGRATLWTCDLSYDYVRINAEYTT